MIGLNKIYNYLINSYRFIILGIVAHAKYSEVPDIENKEGLILYLSLFLYGLVFSLIGDKKIFAVLETIAIFGLISFFGYPILYFLMLVPIIKLIGRKLNHYETLLFTGIFAFLMYLVTYKILYVIVVGFALYMSLNLFNVKFRQISILKEKMKTIGKELFEIKNELSNRDRELDVISKMFIKSKELNELIDEDEVIRHMVLSASEFFNAYYVVLYVKKDNGLLEPYEEVGQNNKYDIPKSISPETIVVPGEISDKAMKIPIMEEDVIWGLLSVYGNRAEFGDKGKLVHFPFQEDDFEILSVYIEQSKFAIKHSKLLQRMSDLANNDFLTKVPNRRHFMSQLDYLLARCKRGESLSVITIDIDHFKQFNDTYGHDVGDKVLVEVAQTLKRQIREIDVIGRMGGEEFGILLPNAHGNELEIAERMREKVSDIKFDDNIRQITISVGIANYGEHGETGSVLLKNSDRALYKAKEEGRNRVIVYEEMDE